MFSYGQDTTNADLSAFIVRHSDSGPSSSVSTVRHRTSVDNRCFRMSNQPRVATVYSILPRMLQPTILQKQAGNPCCRWNLIKRSVARSNLSAEQSIEEPPALPQPETWCHPHQIKVSHERTKKPAKSSAPRNRDQSSLHGETAARNPDRTC